MRLPRRDYKQEFAIRFPCYQGPIPPTNQLLDISCKYFDRPVELFGRQQWAVAYLHFFPTDKSFNG